MLPPDVLHEWRVLAEWRSRYSLVDKLHQLHERNPELAQVLAGYIQRYYGSTWNELVLDVALWPEHTCPVCGGRRMLDDIECWRCQ